MANELGGGYLFELPRDRAKDFFRCREDEAARDFLVAALAAGDLPRQPLDGQWLTLATAFHGAGLDAAVGEPPLQWALLGGRQMFQGEGCTISMARPDMVAHVAQALAAIDSDWLAERAGQADSATAADTLASTVERMLSVYQTAAENGSAVVFAVDREEA